MKPRTNAAIQAALNLQGCKALVVSAAMTIGGAQTPGSVTFASERRQAAPVERFSPDGRAPVELAPIPDSRPTADTATSIFSITWRWPEDEAVRARLVEEGYYWFRGGTTHPQSVRHRHHLQVEAQDEREALAKVEHVITDAGGNARDLEVHRPTAEILERRERMVKVVERVEREESAFEHKRSAK